MRKNEIGYTTEKSVLTGDTEMKEDGEKEVMNCLMRLTDDYLLMTTSKEEAVQFVE